MGFDNRVYTKDQWKDKREKANPKVPSGATKFSMGEALAKFHKAAAKSPEDGLAEAKKLEKVVEGYSKALDKKYKTFNDKVVGQIKFSLEAYIEYYTKIPQQMDAYKNALKIANGTWAPMKTAWTKFVTDLKEGKIAADSAFKHANTKGLSKTLTEAGAAALALGLEDPEYVKAGRAIQKCGLDLEGHGMTEKMAESIDNILAKYKP